MQYSYLDKGIMRLQGRIRMMGELAVLKYCVAVLEKRERSDALYSWLWSIKKKVALYFIRGIESRGQRRVAWFWRMRETLSASLGFEQQPPPPPEPSQSPPPLTDDEKQFILQTHPLLQNTQPVSQSASFQSHCEWFLEQRKAAGHP